LNTEELQKGRAQITWSILEHNDGGVIQLIYAGSPALTINVDGVIEGQKEIFQVASISRELWWSRVVYILAITVQLIVLLVVWFIRKMRSWLFLLMIIFSALLIITGLFRIIMARLLSPPFGF
jgi:uncharacterized membrane protein YhfC